ncbi:conserved hypothetical membrane protein [Sugiyamaella lignohabitans]|uniref:Conserved hypothetical membrane protein n=1 Tax=Sugiyamaella lignohabitans TaxID=796027 RepID=A0A161HFB5_9ASCO|nr:conserved hypothetical membrane protein [Sugiyamaella lignohabitans]ANB14190.1 conserved hypothetical membrane protein [Sugiyamaella lignohabitans]
MPDSSEAKGATGSGAEPQPPEAHAHHLQTNTESIYHPRVDSFWLSLRESTATPNMSSPRSVENSRTLAGSLKCVTALTIALASFSGFLDLKIPEPTNTPSQPNCMQRAASAGVATPPAAKLTTGNLPLLAISSSRSSTGTLSSLALDSSCFLSVIANTSAISSLIRLMWLTASEMSPVPASPLVLNMAAPSLTLRRASPRFLAPHTKGTLKLSFAIWFTLSAGVSTSLSSM